MVRFLHCTCSMTVLTASHAGFDYLTPFASSLYKGVYMYFIDFTVTVLLAHFSHSFFASLHLMM